MSTPSLKRALFAGAVATALAVGGVTTADAASQQIDDVTLTWGLNLEAGSGSFAGGCNFLSAGKAGNAGSSRTWTEDDGFYSASVGNVSILKDGADGPVTPTWATKCLNGAGTAVSPFGISTTNNRVVLSNGTGTVDVDAGTASVSWDGAFTAAFYGGMTYWSAEDLELTVAADGTGTLTGTVSSYAADMTDPTQWAPLAPATVNLATLTGVQVTEDGINVNPDYLGVTLTSVEGQVTSGVNWGAFPDDFVAYHVASGQAAYWYSSGGSADPKKIAAPLSIEWDASSTEPEPESEPEPEPEPEPGESGGDVDVTVQVPDTTTPEPGSLQLSVTGSASLGEATSITQGFLATGNLPEVTITDTRQGGTWTASGQIGNFTSAAGTIPAASLGWTPVLVSGDNAQAGARVIPHAPGLGVSATLASGTEGEARVGAELRLHAAASTPPGSYTAKLTLTAIG